MRTQQIVSEVHAQLPGGLPAIWEQTTEGVRLYLRDDLPPELVTHFRAMCVASPADVVA